MEAARPLTANDFGGRAIAHVDDRPERPGPEVRVVRNGGPTPGSPRQGRWEGRDRLRGGREVRRVRCGPERDKPGAEADRDSPHPQLDGPLRPREYRDGARRTRCRG